jgi:hypothetical protein
VRKYVWYAALAVVVVSCKHPQTSPTPDGNRGPVQTGAVSARAAVMAMMDASKAQDLQALGAVWGTTKGAAREQFSDRVDLEKRELTIMCYLNVDRYTVGGESPEPGGVGRRFDVTLTRGSRTLSSVAHAVPGPDGRWYVQEIEPAPLFEFCRQPNR